MDHMTKLSVDYSNVRVYFGSDWLIFARLGNNDLKCGFIATRCGMDHLEPIARSAAMAYVAGRTS